MAEHHFDKVRVVGSSPTASINKFMSEKSSNKDTGAGKGDKPRNCFSKKYRDNYDSINWGNKKNEEKNTINNDITPAPKRGLSTLK